MPKRKPRYERLDEMFPAREADSNQQASQKSLSRVCKKWKPYRKPTQVGWRQIANVNELKFVKELGKQVCVP